MEQCSRLLAAEEPGPLPTPTHNLWPPLLPLRLKLQLLQRNTHNPCRQLKPLPTIPPTHPLPALLPKFKR
jgi:hypothetical protein